MAESGDRAIYSRTMTMPPALRADAHAVFLDFDGTLVEFDDDPRQVAIAPAALERLAALQRSHSGALAIVSGRRIVDLDLFLAPLTFAAAGVHGLERRVVAGGETLMLAGPEALDTVRAALAAPLAAMPGLSLEDKGTALVIHYRTAPKLSAPALEMMQSAIADRSDLVLMQGEGIVEVHPAGMDKGRAVADLMQEKVFAGRIPVYVGDDVTDEFALAYVREAGGVSVKIGKAQSAAEFRLEDVTALHRWLGVRAR
ncbi:trehalose 6-phosphate phosphatase [Aureimonas glaciei]|uniref:Trehalose 6-phosphate phosphatase n=2 Tax=Aureimonas glaciei TaxID=1776957 RepID=A0A917DBQ6_9HYPH|nr:trehalose 6-phosphate phosphatase [Aureimonas glaciei]